MRKRILINAIGAKIGGAKTYIINFLRELKDLDKKNEYFVFVSPALIEQFSDMPSNIHILTSKFATKSQIHRILWEQIYLPLFIRRRRIDSVFSAGSFAILLCPARQAVLLRNPTYFAVRYLTHLIGTCPIKGNIKLFLHRLLICISIRVADIVLTPTDTMRDMVSYYFKMPAGRSFTAYYGYSNEHTSAKLPIEKKSDEIWVAYLTLFTPFKNFLTILRSIALVARHLPNVKFIFTMDFDNEPYLTFLKDEIEQLGIRNRIIQLKSLPRTQALTLLKKSDIFIFASVLESFGHPMVEAMAAGLPTVAADVPINREILGDAAIYFEPLNSEELAEKIQLLLDNRQLRDKLSRAALERSRQFSWGEHIRQMLHLLMGENIL